MSYETSYAARKRAESDRRDSTPEALANAARKREIDEKIAAEVDRRFPGLREFEVEVGSEDVSAALSLLAALQAVRYYEEWPDSYPAPTPEEIALVEADAIWSCAWCGAFESDEDEARAEAGALVSHGLCDRCEADLVDEGIDAAREEALR